MEMLQSVQTNRIQTLEESCKYLWDTANDFRDKMDLMKEDMAKIRVDVAKVVTIVGIVQTLATAAIVWKFTH